MSEPPFVTLRIAAGLLSAACLSAFAAQAFAQGAAVQSINPKAWLVAMAGVGIFVLPLTGRGMALSSALAWFSGVSLLACLLGVGCWAVLGKALARWLQTPRRQRSFNLLLAATLVASVLGVLA